MDSFEKNNLYKELSKLYENKKEIKQSINKFAYNPVARDRLYKALKITIIKIKVVKKKLGELK